jgi:tetratricopeptide (TPR) repeat protein
MDMTRRKASGSVCTASLILIFFSVMTAGTGASADVNDLIFQGAEHHYKGELERAIRSFEAAVRVDRANEYAHNQLGVLYAKQGRFDNAFDEFSHVAGIDRRNTFALMWLGILHMRDGDLEPAVKKFKEILDIDPQHADAYYFLGSVYNFMHDPDMAIHYLKKAKEADSEEADTHFRLAKAFHHLNMTANAMLEYQRTIALKPTHTRAMNELGWIHYNKDDYDSAISFWKKVLTINQKDRDAVSNLAKAYNDLAWKALASGNTPEAVQFWKKTLKVNPSNKAAKYYLKVYGS